MAKCFFRRKLIPLFASWLLAVNSVQSGQVPKQDRSWKRYYNRVSRYCLSYPSRWYKGEAFDGAGLFVETGVKKFSKPIGEIDVTTLEPSNGAPQAKAISLIENFQVHLDGLRKFEGAERMTVLEERQSELSGDPALFTKDQFYDPQDHAEWTDEMIFVTHNQTTYRLELQCRSDQLTRFEPVFTRLAGSFEPECTPQKAGPAN